MKRVKRRKNIQRKMKAEVTQNFTSKAEGSRQF